MKVGLLHPGAMGSTLGQTLLAGGHQVYWVSTGRSPATAARAADFVALPSVTELVAQVEAIVSVCPPDNASEVAQSVADGGFTGLYLDANAVAPQTTLPISRLFGTQFVDGGIIGPPAHQAGTTRLYLSGANAPTLAGWFSAGPLTAEVVGDKPGAASALKMCYAAYSKGVSALVLAVRAAAAEYDVNDALVAEWERSQPGMAARSEKMAQGTAPKAWRFAGEMQEIATTFAAVGLPAGFHQAAAEVFERMAPLQQEANPDLNQVLAKLQQE